MLIVFWAERRTEQQPHDVSSEGTEALLQSIWSNEGGGNHGFSVDHLTRCSYEQPSGFRYSEEQQARLGLRT